MKKNITCISGMAAILLLAAGATRAAVTPDATNSFFEDARCLPDLLGGIEHKVVCLPAETSSPEPKLDGVLDDAIWKDAQPLTGFTPSPHSEGREAPSVEAWIARGKDALYIATKTKYTVPKDLPKESQSLGVPGHYVRHLFNPDYRAWKRVEFHSSGGGEAWASKGEASTNTTYFRDYIVPRSEPGAPGRAANRLAGGFVITEAVVPYKMIADASPAQGDEWGFDLESAWSELIKIPNSDQYQKMPCQARWCVSQGDSHSQVDKWGRIFFGTSEERSAKYRSPTVRVYTDRARYADTDESGEGLVEILQETDPVSAFTLALSLEDSAGKVVSSHDAGETKTGAVGLFINPRALKHGSYKLSAVLSKAGKVVAEAKCPFERFAGEPLAKVSQNVIPIKLFNDNRLGEAVVPVSIGVPMPKGFAADTAKFVLEQNTDLPWNPVWKPVPAQFTVRSRWYRNGSIKWLAVMFDAEYRQGWPAMYRLNMDGKTNAPKVEKELAVAEDDSAITVTTGPAKFVMSKKAFRLLDAAWLDMNANGSFEDDEQLVKAGDKDGLWYENHTKARMNAAHAETTVKVTESGPMGAVVLAEGWYAAGGKKECIFKTRLFFARGSATVKVKHSWINTADSRSTKVRDISLQLGIPGVKQYAFGAEDGTIFDGAMPADGVYQIQLSSKRFAIETGDGKPIVPGGGRMGGWVFADTGRGAVSLAGRSLWRLYPKELAASPDGLALHIWPVHGRELFPVSEQLEIPNLIKLLSAHQGRELDFQMPESYFNALGKYWNDEWLAEKAAGPSKGGGPFIFWKALRGFAANAQGVATSVELDLTLHAKNETAQEARRRATILDVSPHGVADPAWTQATEVLGPLHKKDVRRFGTVERYLEDIFDRTYIAQTDQLDDYGMWNWPDNHNYAYDAWNKSARAIHRCWVNSHYQEPRMCYLMYLRSGEGKYWRYAGEKCRHAMDVDAVNYGDDKPIGPFHQRGSTYHCKGVLHWGGNGSIQGHMVSYDFMLLNYFLTGDPRGPGFVAMWTGEIIRDCYLGEPERESGAVLSEAIDAYQHLRDPRMLRFIHWNLESQLNSPLEQYLAAPDFNYMLWWRMLQFTGDGRVEKILAELWGDGSKDKRMRFGYGLMTYVAFKVIGDKRILFDVDMPDKPAQLMNNPRYTISHPVAYNLGTVPYLMTAMDEIGATGDVMLMGIDNTARKTFWKPYVEEWLKENKLIWGAKPKL